MNGWWDKRRNCTNIYTLNADDFIRGFGFHGAVRKHSKALIQWLNVFNAGRITRGRASQ
jgi:hypothetical protein